MISLRFRLLLPTAIVLIAASSARAVDYLNPENGHYYRFLSPSRELTWDNARVAAFSQTHNGLRGHLATITSPAEQAFFDQLPNSQHAILWLGGFQPSGSPEPDGNWQWVTGEPFSYSNWAPFEPNELFGEYLIEMWPADNFGGVISRYWNDLSATHYAGNPRINRRQFVIEFTPGYAPRLNGNDFLNWQRDLGKPSPLYGRADFNGDGVISGADLQVWRTAGFVPEPTAATLLITAGAICKGLRLSTKRQAPQSMARRLVERRQAAASQ